MNDFQKNFKPQPFKRLNVEGMSFLMSPPEDGSEKTSVELELLENVGRRVKEEDLISIKKYNKDKKRVKEVITFVKKSGGIEYTTKKMIDYNLIL